MALPTTAPEGEPILPFTSLQTPQFAQVVSGSIFSSTLSDPAHYYGPVTIRAHHSSQRSSSWLILPILGNYLAGYTKKSLRKNGDKGIPDMTRLFLGLATELKYVVCAPEIFPLQTRVDVVLGSWATPSNRPLSFLSSKQIFQVASHEQEGKWCMEGCFQAPSRYTPLSSIHHRAWMDLYVVWARDMSGALIFLLTFSTPV